MAIVPTEKLTNRIVLLIGRHPLRQTQQQGAIRPTTHGQEGLRPEATVHHVSLDFGFVQQRSIYSIRLGSSRHWQNADQ
jgi:hypothetical protein